MDYDEDTLQLWEQILFSPIHPSMREEYAPRGTDILTGLPLKGYSQQQTTPSQLVQKDESLRLDPNEVTVTNWHIKRPSTTTAESPPSKHQRKEPYIQKLEQVLQKRPLEPHSSKRQKTPLIQKLEQPLQKLKVEQKQPPKIHMSETKKKEIFIEKLVQPSRNQQLEPKSTKGKEKEPLFGRPILINGSNIANWNSLLPSTTIQEIKMRMSNEIQKFRTREGEDIFIAKETLMKLDFKKILDSKTRKIRINLPERHEVRLHVYKDGKIMMYNHQKRKRQTKKNVN